MPRRIGYEQDAEIKRKGNTDYLKTDTRSRDGWRPIRTFNAATGEWRLTALGRRYYADHEGLPEYMIRTPAILMSMHSPGGTRNMKAGLHMNFWILIYVNASRL